MTRHRIAVHWGALAFLLPFVVMGWFLAGIGISSTFRPWWLLVLWLGPPVAFCVRWLFVALVELGVIEVSPRLWSEDERERQEREAGL